MSIFSSVPLRAPKLNRFNLSHDVKLTCEMGQLIPIMMEPVLPSDRFKISTEQLVRFAPLQSPIMSDIDVYVHFYFVPNRLIWNNWETFITGSKNGKKLEDSEVPSPPFALLHPSLINFTQGDMPSGIGSGSVAKDIPVLQNCSLADYLGFQTFSASELSELSSKAKSSYPLDELPFRAYQRVWFDYFRDENLSDVDDFSSLIHEHDGNALVNTPSMLSQYSGLFSLRQRAWRKDYFTSALPWAQKGDDVLIPGSSSVDVSFKDGAVAMQAQNYSRLFHVVGANHSSSINGKAIVGKDAANSNLNTQTAFNLGFEGDGDNLSARISPSVFYLNPLHLNPYLDSSTASEGTIRELRRAFAAQAFLERRAIGGTRYNEQIMAFFGVKTSDGRLQRAEFLGGSKQPVVISQVLQTSESTDSSPLAEPAGTAVSAGGKYIFDRQFEEYGFIVGLLSVLPRANYMRGIPRKYNKRDVYDYYFPQFARIGEQEISNSELYFDVTQPDSSTSNSDVFGYAPRYSEYRFINSRIHGDFLGSLDFWHLARDFDKIPALNESFITCRPSSRIFAYENSDFSHLWVDVHVNCKALRPLPKYAESY